MLFVIEDRTASRRLSPIFEWALNALCEMNIRIAKGKRKTSQMVFHDMHYIHRVTFAMCDCRRWQIPASISITSIGP